MLRRILFLFVALALLALSLKPPLTAAQEEPPDLYPCGEVSPSNVPGVSTIRSRFRP